MNKGKNIVDQLFSFLIALLPFTYQYASPIASVSFGELLLIPFMLFYLIKFISKGARFTKSYNGYYIYILLSCIMTVFALVNPYFSLSDFSTVFVRMIYYSILVFVAIDNINIKTTLKTCMIFAVIFSVYAIIQFFVYKVTGTYLPTTLSAKWVFGPESGIRTDYAEYYKYLYRPSSLFLEPSYYAIFCGPGLVFSLLSNIKSKKNLFYGIIISLGLIVSASSAGLIIIIISWFSYLLRVVYNNKRFSIKGLLLAGTLVVLALLVFSSSISSVLLSRTETGGSFNNRITRGLLLLDNLNIYQHIFGVGISNLSNFVNYNHFYTKYDEINLNYAATFIGTYLKSGIFVFLSLIYFFVKSIKVNKSFIGKVFVYLFLVICMFEMMEFSYRFGFYSIILIALPNIEICKSRIDGRMS
jgi:hypothetical protein